MVLASCFFGSAPLARLKKDIKPSRINSLLQGLFFFGPGVGFVVDFGEVLEVQVGVDLGR